MLSCSLWFSALSFCIGGGLVSHCVGGVCGADIATATSKNSVQKTSSRTATSAPHTRPTERLSRPPPIKKLGAENHMLQLNIWCSWWWTCVPEICRAKNTLIKLIVASSWHFKLLHFLRTSRDYRGSRRGRQFGIGNMCSESSAWYRHCH